MDLVDVTDYRRAHARADLGLGPGETVLGGGTWLFSEPQPGTTGLVDLTTLGWRPWEIDRDGLRIAATCTIAELLAMPAEQSLAALVRACAESLLMSFKIQHAATVGGNLCLGLPAGAMTSLTSGLGATALVWTPDGGERREPVATFVRGVRETSLRPGEVLRAIEVPASSLATRTAIRRTSLSPQGRAASVVVGRAEPDTIVLTLTAATTRPVVVHLPPAAPVGAWEARSATEAALAGVDCWYDDPHGPADWRAQVSSTLAAGVWQELSR